jgi:hypothetical protein
LNNKEEEEDGKEWQNDLLVYCGRSRTINRQGGR